MTDYSSLKGMEGSPCEEWSALPSKLHFYKINRVQGDSSPVLGSLCKLNKELVAAQININYPPVETPTTCYSLFQQEGASSDIYRNNAIHFYTATLIQRSQMASLRLSHHRAKLEGMGSWEGWKRRDGVAISEPWGGGKSHQMRGLDMYVSEERSGLCRCNKQPLSLGCLDASSGDFLLSRNVQNLWNSQG